MGAITIDSDFQSLLIPLTSDEYQLLEQSIINEGCRDAIVLWDGIIIDGHNRYAICTKHGINYKTIEMKFDNRQSAKTWIILNQLGRRNISAFLSVKYAVDYLKPLIAEKAKAKQKTDGKDLGGTLCQKSDKGVIHTTKELALAAGVSHDTVHRVEKILEKAPKEVITKLSTGDISINQAYQQVRKAEKVEAVEKRIEEHKKVQTGTVDIYNTDKKYNIVYADPAWSYWDGGQKNQSLHYTTMTIDDIKGLPVSNITDDNCILFIWVTYPILQEALEVIKSWGFNYSTCGFVWVKKNKSGEGNFFGLGSWTRANTELCLIATKGSILRMDASISQVIEAPIDEHSKKPDIVRHLITKLVGELPRIELFSRKPAEGWDVWGNEA